MKKLLEAIFPILTDYCHVLYFTKYPDSPKESMKFPRQYTRRESYDILWSAYPEAEVVGEGVVKRVPWW